MSSTTQSQVQSDTGSRRHTYQSATPGSNSPTSPSSPLSLPPLSADMTSPTSTTSSIQTPNTSSTSSPESILHMTDHSLLTSFSTSKTPPMGSLSPPDFYQKSFPLLPAHRPLHKKLYSVTREQISPPHTPKGHPIEETSAPISFPFKKRTHSITNPYNGSTQSYTTTLTYLLRVPRRLRPAFLVGFCIITFGLVYLNHAMHQATLMDTLVSQRQAAEMSRRFIPADGVDGLLGINDRSRQGVMDDEALNQEQGVEGIVFNNKKDELAALTGFITSTTSNAIPHVDTSKPLDPAIILDFDPTGLNAREDLDLLVHEINTIYPLVLFGRMRDPWHREVKKMLAEYKITPSPLIIDVDQRRDASVFLPILTRLLGSAELPRLLLKGESLGSYHEVLELRESGKLISTLEASGAVSVSVRDAKKKKKGVRERERMENERILGPAPIIVK